MRRAGLAIALAACVVLLPGLGARDFWEPDEPRHGAIAEEMRALRDGPAQIVVPRLNGTVYTQKPPLYYWLAALAGAPAGVVSEGAARLPSALAALATVLVVLAFGNAALGGPAGAVGALVLVTLPAFADAARQARPDALLAFFVTAAAAAAWRFDRGLGRPAWSRRALHLAIGLGALTKGPVAAALPLLGMLVYLAWERRLGVLRALFRGRAWLLSAGPPAVWLAAAWATAPEGFVGEAVVENVVGRYLGGVAHDQPLLYYAKRLPVAFLPWTALWPLAAWRIAAELRGGERSARASSLRFLVSFAGTGLLLFTLSAGKRGIYLLPLYPALALLTAQALAGRLPAGAPAARPRHGWSAAAPLVAAAGIVACAAALLAAGVPASIVGPGAALVGAGALLPWERLAGGRALAARGVAVAVAAEAVVFGWVLPRFDASRSVRAAATVAAAFAPPGTPVGVVRNGSIVGGVAYYADRPVVAIGSESGLRRFVEAGGRALVLESRQLPALAALEQAGIVFRQDLDGDELLVVRVKPSGASAPDRLARAGEP